MKTTKEKVSYCIGLEAGRNLKQQFADLDLDLLIQGMKDVFVGGQMKLSQEEIRAVLTALRDQITAQEKEYVTRLSEENRKISETFLEENKKKEGVQVMPSGLQYKVLSAGPEGGAQPRLLDQVKVHYRGTFINGNVFDSSYDRGAPQVLPVNRMIPGWSEALQKMKVGDKWQLFIPPYLAYGEAGFGPEIAPNTCLIFELELIAINDGSLS